MSKYYLTLTTFLFTLLLSCGNDDNYIPISETDDDPIMTDDEGGTDNMGVTIDLTAVPFTTLSEYGFFDGELKNLIPNDGVLEYSLINTLFSDYSKKKRFIWMPEGVTATYDADDTLLVFPVGTIIIKNFFYDNVLPQNARRILETRLLINTINGWEFADYIWNESQTEAIYNLDGSNVDIMWELNGETRSVNYRIPSEAECQTCHKTGDTSVPIGPRPQNLNRQFTYTDGTTANQLDKWIEEGYLQSAPTDINALVDWQDTSAPLKERVRSYFEINCAHCHIDEGHCSYRPIRLDYTSSILDENIGICVEPEEDLGNGISHIIRPNNIGRSAMYFRLNTTAEEVRMPLLGRTLIHDEAIVLLEEFINNLDIECE
ncbi:hypothetical protein [uncultured Dokdonia sp.]|uniref:hypothetical protein n=1 Tax=uncultured Dokdonia sp. TaxID=575653 RepID=UPI0026129AE0|nr:hypothetical protein [uncultured Dokdonia sp.]